MDIEFQKLNHFVTVAKHRNLSRAAVELNISQPALSRSIASLEDRAGLRLFDRSRSGMSLTPSGQVIFLEAEKIVRDAKDLGRHMKLYGSGDGGRVHLGITPAISAIMLPYLGMRMLRSKPLVQMISSIRPADVLMKDLLEGKIDLMICPRETAIPSFELSIEVIGKFENVLVARSGHPVFSKTNVTAPDLAVFPLAAVANYPVHPVIRSSGSFICENDYIIREIVLNSDAVWLASRRVVQSDLEGGALRTLDIKGLPEMDISASLIRLKGRQPSPIAQRIVDWSKDFFVA